MNGNGSSDIVRKFEVKMPFPILAIRATSDIVLVQLKVRTCTHTYISKATHGPVPSGDTVSRMALFGGSMRVINTITRFSASRRRFRPTPQQLGSPQLH